MRKKSRLAGGATEKDDLQPKINKRKQKMCNLPHLLFPFLSCAHAGVRQGTCPIVRVSVRALDCGNN